MRKYQATNDYSGREVDIELLQSVQNIPFAGRTYASISKEPVRMTTGFEKMVQRYVIILLTELGSKKFDQTVGSGILKAIRSGTVSSESDIKNLFNEADKNARDIMSFYDDNEYGEDKQDETIEETNLIGIDIDYAKSTVSLSVSISARSGDNTTFIVPISTGIE